MTKSNTVTVIEENWDYCHMPSSADMPDTVGMTVRQLLRVLRRLGRENCGNIASPRFFLSDRTAIECRLRPVDGGCRLMSSQKLTRVDLDDCVIRTYSW